jgi:hypothetical protein
MLHIIFCDLIEAVSECQILIRYLKTERNDISVYNTLHDEAVDLVEQFKTIYTSIFACSQKNKKFLSKSDYHQYILQTLHTRRLVHVLIHQFFTTK